jgi:hypothetical protein
VDTVALGVQRTPDPSRVSGVRNMETPSRSVLLVEGGKPTVRRAEFLGGNRMLKKRRPAAERRQETGDHGPAPPLVVSA